MKKVIGALLMLALVWVLPAQAVKTKSIYEAEVPVSSQDAKLRDQAIQQAFVQTLMKMSGSNQILQNPSIRAVLANAGNEVDEFSYLPSQENGLPYILKVRFDAKAMKKILTEAKEPVWGENRSLILLWLTMETPGHAPEILDNQSNQEFAQFIKKEALKRGLPAMLPMMDISEL
ncbi:MAG TPA: DUF2066 domain-containing protein, partial [Gammaproteobacteria bacterium]|nr:DUF2066 domain-containing protein [Gammaproteobacteria bacterium]